MAGCIDFQSIDMLFLTSLELDGDYTDIMNPEQIAQAKLDFEEQFLEICPEGMCFPVIEYECEEGISLQFYNKAYLDATPISRNSAVMDGQMYIQMKKKCEDIFCYDMKTFSCYYI